MEGCEYTFVWFGLGYDANCLFLDGYHCPVLHLIICLGVLYDETQEQEDEECPFRMSNRDQSDRKRLPKLTLASFIYISNSMAHFVCFSKASLSAFIIFVSAAIDTMFLQDLIR